MFRNFTILSLLLLFSFSLFAQDLQVSPQQGPQKISRLNQVVVNKPITANMKRIGHQINSVQALNPVISNNGYFYSNYQMVPTGKSLNIKCIYLVTAAEMAAAGITSGTAINEIMWSYYDMPSADVTGTLKVYLQNSTDAKMYKPNAWQTSVIDSMTLAADNSSFTMTTTNDYPSQTLSGFTYTGSSLYIAFELINTSTNTGTSFLINYDGSANTRVRLYEGATTPATHLGVLTGIRPETYLGTPLLNDAGVLEVYTLGKLPIPYAAPHTISAAVANNGDDVLTSKVVTLNVTGANTYTETQTIPTMDPGYYYDVTFTGWTPTVAGTNTITVSIPSDNNNTNNSKSVTQLITYNTYTYSYGPFPPTSDGGVGFTGATGDFVAKFHTASATSVNQVVVNFAGGGLPFKIGIWDATGTGGIPGTLLWESASQTSTTGVFTLLVNPKVNVNGDFYVGVRQTGTANVNFAFQNEDPIRASTFYYTSPTGSSTWEDFAASNSPFRFMIEPRLTLANDVGVSTIDNPLGGTYFNLITPSVQFSPKATVANFGSNDQGSFNVTMTILDAGDNQVYTNTKSISSLNAGSTQQITFDATSFTPTAQEYIVQCYSSLGTDADNTNDMVSASIHYSNFQVDLSALLEAMYVAGGTAMLMTPEVTVELHDGTTLALVESKTGLLSTDGVGTINNFTSALNNLSSYYLAVKSANTLETWSAAAHNFTSGVLSYDFTTAVGQAYTDGSAAPLALHGGMYCIYSGDVNQDGIVSGDDYTGVDNDNSNFDYHLVNDVNGDGVVSGDDFTFIDNNNSAFVGRQVPPGAPGLMAKRVINSQVSQKSTVK